MKIQPAGDRPLLHKLYSDGLPPGCLTGWPNVNEHYTVGASQFTVINGIPNHGKSEWLDALLINLLDRPLNGKAWKFLVCSPENHPQEQHESKLLSKIVGKPFAEHSVGRMSWAEADEAREILSARFEFVELEERDSFADLLVAARDFVLKNKAHQVGIVLDPWNQLEHCRPQHMSETEYISEALSAASRITRKTTAHMWMVAHPAKLAKDRDSGKRPVPSPYDISGSAHWFNKSDNCITIHRDVTNRDALVEVHIQKVRFKHIGHPGIARLRYDYLSGRYSDPDPMHILRVA